MPGNGSFNLEHHPCVRALPVSQLRTLTAQKVARRRCDLCDGDHSTASGLFPEADAGEGGRSLQELLG